MLSSESPVGEESKQQQLLVAALFAASERCGAELGELLYDLGERLQAGEDYRHVALAIAALELPEPAVAQVVPQVEDVGRQEVKDAMWVGARA